MSVRIVRNMGDRPVSVEVPMGARMDSKLAADFCEALGSEFPENPGDAYWHMFSIDRQNRSILRRIDEGEEKALEEGGTYLFVPQSNTCIDLHYKTLDVRRL